uniref:Putative ovule protein n=1 Tax=Solanum chacoense TaxID=4108 RepID=A0A0V0HA98_SOLCH
MLQFYYYCCFLYFGYLKYLLLSVLFFLQYFRHTSLLLHFYFIDKCSISHQDQLACTSTNLTGYLHLPPTKGTKLYQPRLQQMGRNHLILSLLGIKLETSKMMLNPLH